jgi:hypothetical protein
LSSGQITILCKNRPVASAEWSTSCRRPHRSQKPVSELKASVRLMLIDAPCVEGQPRLAQHHMLVVFHGHHFMPKKTGAHWNTMENHWKQHHQSAFSIGHTWGPGFLGMPTAPHALQANWPVATNNWDPTPPSHVFFLDGCSFFVFPIAQIMSKYEETVATFPTKLQDLIRQFCKARAAGKQTGTTPAVLKNISAFDSGQFLQQMKNFANPSKPTWKRNIHCKNPTGPSIMSKLCMCWRSTALSCIILVIWHLATLW